MADVETIEINRPPTRLERAFEILPGLTSWGFLLSILVLSFIRPTIAAYMIIGFDLLWLGKSFGMSRRMIQGYARLHRYEKYRWQHWLDKLNDVDAARAELESRARLGREASWFQRVLAQNYLHKSEILRPAEVYNAVMITAYNESLDILEPTVQSVLASNYDPKHIILIMAYEARDGAQSEAAVQKLIETYGHHFRHAMACKHPLTEGEVRGKGGNITYAGRRLVEWVGQHGIDPENVIVTTLDADNRPHSNYFAYLTFVYCLIPDRKYKSFQPLPMFYNNIWDAPAPMRLIAVGNSFWMIIQSMRPHLLRNFSSHAQSLAALIDTNFWSVRTIVEDGHQYWRTYFRYDGRHDAIPLYIPVFQDAVLADGYWRTFRAQFKQIRRWAWGASDISYFVSHALHNKQISLWDKISKFARHYEATFSWATAPLVLALAGWLPLFLSPHSDQNIIAHQLPIIASRIQMVATLGIIISVLLTLISLPPRPAHHRRRRSIGMVLQWVLLPFTGIFFGSLAALNAQTRLMLGRYLETFDVTEKAVHKARRQTPDTPPA